MKHRKTHNNFFFKFLTLALSSLMICGVSVATVGCTPGEDSGGIRIVCTIFPQYDWVRVLTAGDNDISVEILQTTGADLHNFQPTASDITTIYRCDAFFYIGGESDGWVDDVLASPSVSADMKSVSLLEALGERSLEEEEVPGSEEESGEHDHEHEYDEHIWLSLKNAKILCQTICDTLTELNPKNQTLYESNLAAYTAQLDELDASYQDVVASAERTVLLFADRFPFRYLTEDYGLEYYAAFSGCSAESEASFATITALAGKVDELALPYVLVLDGSDKKIAQAVIGAVKIEKPTVLTINSLQSVTQTAIHDGANYLEMMSENLTVLQQALN